jgi:hypothetical protein
VNNDGIIAVSWYDRRDDPENRNYRLRMSASLDGGESWAPSVPVSEADFIFRAPAEFPTKAWVSGGGDLRAREKTDHFDVSVQPGPRLYTSSGDYAALVAGADGRFHTFWVDNRTGVAQLYTASAKVEGKSIKNGWAELAGMENVTSKLNLRATQSEWEPKSRSITLAFQFTNTSKDTIRGPLRMRLTNLRGDLGNPVLDLPAGRQRGSGALVDLEGLIPESGLLPGATSEKKQLVVRFDPFLDATGYGWEYLVSYTARVFAKVK